MFVLYRIPLLLQLKMTLRYFVFFLNYYVFTLSSILLAINGNAASHSEYSYVPIFQLARYLNRTYWEKKQEEARKSPTPSAPAPVPLAESLPAINQPVESHVPVQPVSIVEVC